MVDAIQQALLMSPGEQRERMRLMREIVRERNVYRWAGQMLLDAVDLRKRKRIIEMVSEAASLDRQVGAVPSELRPLL